MTVSPAVRELLSAPGRRLLVANSKRYRTAAFANELVTAALALRDLGELEQADDCAEMGVVVARKFGRDLLARSLAEYGNILRIRNYLRRSRVILDEALSTPCSAATRLNAVSYAASLELDIGNFDAADRLLRLGLELSDGDRDRARFLIQRGITLQYAAEPEAAARVLLTALRLVPSDQPRLALSVGQTYATALCDAGWPEQAQVALERCSHLLQFATELDSAKLRWAQGKIAARSCLWQAALHFFADARDAFDKRELIFEVSLLDLESAIVLAQIGRKEEAIVVTRQAQTGLTVLGVPRDALVAELLAQAIQAPSVDCLGLAVRALLLWRPSDAEA